jgi:hypothetical protein
MGLGEREEKDRRAVRERDDLRRPRDTGSEIGPRDERPGAEPPMRVPSATYRKLR